MNSPLIDITALCTVQAKLMGVKPAPWGSRLLEDFADLFIYSDQVRYPLPLTGGDINNADLPEILTILVGRDSDAFEAAPYPVIDPMPVESGVLNEALTAFLRWGNNNWATLRDWLRLFSQPWIVDVRRPRCVFALDALNHHPAVVALADRIGYPSQEVVFAFDVVLRYPEYGRIAGSDQRYLNHPIRDVITLPTEQPELAPIPKIPIRFGPEIRNMDLSLDACTALLHAIRGEIRKRGIQFLQPGQIDREVLREIVDAPEVRLPLKLSGSAQTAAVVAGLLGAASAIQTAAPAAAVLGGALSIAAFFWRGKLPRKIPRLRILRWVTKSSFEEQLDDRT